MPKVVRTPVAEQDLVGIAVWIAQHNESAAYSIHSGMRRITTGNYVIYYRLLDGGETVEIDRVVHGARDVGNLFP